jgi:hypothetical protein
MIVTIDHQAGMHQMLDEAGISTDVLAQSMSDLNHSANTPAAIPASACDA